MAALHSPSRLPTPPSSTGRRSTAPAAPKLRDSCHACASSKLKCYKEKPTCSRCANRGITCEYIATRRGGRKHDNRSSINGSSNTSSDITAAINVSQLLSPPSSWFAPSTTISSTDSQSPSGVTHASSGPTTSSASSNLFPSLISQVNQSLPSALADLTTDLDGFGASPLSGSVPDLFDLDILSQTHFLPTGADSSSNFDTLPVLEDAVPEFLALSNHRSPSNSQASPTSEVPSYPDTRTTDSPCFCLVWALGLMKQLFPSPSTACTTSATKGLDKLTSIPTIQAVITKNEHIIKAVSTMLECSCSQDGYLLAIMSLITFKVLGWYAAAARKTPSFSNDDNNVQSPRTSHSRHQSHREQVLQESAVIGSYCLDGENSARMAAQPILSELHRVQRLVHQLSMKLKGQAAENSEMTDTSSSSSYENANSETTLSLSTMMLNRLEIDLRKRLRTLSLKIVEELRRE